MTHLLRVAGSRASKFATTDMKSESFLEKEHLESWLSLHPDVLGDGLKIVSTQFNNWESSDGGAAREALDILALSSSGQTVVVELKRGSDRKVHLQAITYGALVASFTREQLADAHAKWVNKTRQTPISSHEAMEELHDHLDAGWDDEILKLPKIVLVAEEFSDQTVTTVQWLKDVVAPQLDIECHEYSLFRDGNDVLVGFQIIYPVENLDGRTLRPSASVNTDAVRQRIATNKRRARSVKIIAEAGRVSNGSEVSLNLVSLVKPDVANEVEAWLDADPDRKKITWHNHPQKPLRWAAADDANASWSPTALRDEIFERAGGARPTFSAADAWCVGGENLYSIAEQILAETEAVRDEGQP
ncbi:hypothetical protein KLP28_13505 [Nocardioidaceae bacterium]|nr:hypothetical protein KLP28_13505 [Nocardioidaceae bacterium]